MATKKDIKLRVIFMGTGKFAAEILDALFAGGYNLVAIFSQPDKGPENKKNKPNPITAISQKNKTPLFQPQKLDEKIFQQLKLLKPDIIIVASYGKILPREILGLPGFGCINIHASLLPKFRGPSPIQNTLIAGEKETGISIFKMNDKIDAGEILARETVPVEPDETFQPLYGKLSKIASELLLKTLPLLVAGKIVPVSQDAEKATYCQLIERNDGRIFWDEEARKIYNKFRGLYPWPGIFSFWKKDSSVCRIKFHEIELYSRSIDGDFKIGQVAKIGEKIGIKTSKGFIILKKIQLEGKEVAEIGSFINGYPSFIGSVLS